MFGALFFERDPLGWQDVPRGFITFVQDAGGFAAVGLLLWLLLGLPRMRPEDRARIPVWQSVLFLVGTAGAAVFYLLLLGLRVVAFLRSIGDHGSGRARVVEEPSRLEAICLLAGGACALFAVTLPFLRNLVSVRPRRVWALTRLSFKEAIRRRALYAFSGLALVFLFGSWFISAKPENQVRTYVGVVFDAMTWLLLLAAMVLAAFSIPDDVRRQTIHTIVTKPVERFEIVLGRFFGFLGLMTLVLVVLTAASLLYVVRGVHPDAAAESLKARVPLYGDLTFRNTKNEKQGENVGREWGYRSYITAPKKGEAPNQAPVGVWSFPTLPAVLADRPEVACEFTFDIYRGHKSEKENRGLACSFAFKTHNYVEGNDVKYRAALHPPGGGDATMTEDQAADEFGYHEFAGVDVKDYHTQTLELPGGLFRNALRAGNRPGAPLRVEVRCLSEGQFVGVARYDLYLREDAPSAGAEQTQFAINFFKGAFGLWLCMGLLIGIAVALSTYLSGVISLLVAVLIYLGGLCLPFIQNVATGTNPEGGPAMSALRLAKQQAGSAPLEENAATRAAERADDVFRWIIRRVSDVIPDVDRFDLKPYVAEGFNIGAAQLALNVLLMLAYLLPWAVLGYYLLRWREVASAT